MLVSLTFATTLLMQTAAPPAPSAPRVVLTSYEDSVRWPRPRPPTRPGAARPPPTPTRPAPASSPFASSAPEPPGRAPPCDAAASGLPISVDCPTFG